MLQKEIIISLIKDDLTNIRLVSGLEKLGLDSGKYYLNLSQTFFTLMGFKDNEQNDSLHKQYVEFAQKSLTTHPDELSDLANEVFERLNKGKKLSKSKNS